MSARDTRNAPTLGAFPFVRLIGFSRASTDSRTGIAPSSFPVRATRSRGGGRKRKTMTIQEEFANWFDSVGFTPENNDDVVVLYDDINNGFSDSNADFQVIKKGDKFVIQPSDKDFNPFEYPAESKSDLLSYLNSLYEHGDVHGEETFLHNMDRDN